MSTKLPHELQNDLNNDLNKDLNNDIHNDLNNFKNFIEYDSILDKEFLKKSLSLDFLAMESLIIEAKVTPKPGLVDYISSGSHKDMDYNTFLKSSKSLLPYFTKLKEIGESNQSTHNENTYLLTKEVMELGIEAKDTMLKATNGINTHKGAIFSLGLFLLCGSYLNMFNFKSKKEKLCTLNNLISYNAKIYFNNLNFKSYESHGTNVRAKFNTGTIIDEAVNGYPSVFSIGLDVLDRSLKKGFSLNRSLLQTLYSIIPNISDSNLLKRGGLIGEEFMKETSFKIVESMFNLSNEDFYKVAINFKKRSVEQNLSPGGAADLLACTYFIYKNIS